MKSTDHQIPQRGISIETKTFQLKSKQSRNLSMTESFLLCFVMLPNILGFFGFSLDFCGRKNNEVGNRVYSLKIPTDVSLSKLFLFLDLPLAHITSTMAQVIDPIPNDDQQKLLCCYVNATSKIQVARITNIANWYFERVVFPGQRLVFEALPEAQLEIHTGMMASSILSDRIPCSELSLQEEMEGLLEPEPQPEPIVTSSPASV